MSEERELTFLEQVERSAANLIEHGQLYNDEEKIRMLNMLPYVYEKAANEATTLSYELDRAKLDLKRLKNKRLLDAIELKDTLDLKNMADRNAWAEDCEEYRNLEDKILELARDKEFKQHQADRFQSQFQAINKQITKDINSDYMINMGQRRMP